MTNQQAIGRLRNRDSFLVTKIEDAAVADRAKYWAAQDREAIAFAIAALEYVIQVEIYEGSQSSPSTS